MEYTPLKSDGSLAYGLLGMVFVAVLVGVGWQLCQILRTESAPIGRVRWVLNPFSTTPWKGKQEKKRKSSRRSRPVRPLFSSFLPPGLE
jgi:hypothetical protein